MSKCSFESINHKQVLVCEELVPGSQQLVVMSHGFRGDSCGPARQFVDFARLLNQHQISVVRFDQPHSGNSEGNYLDSSFNEWIKTTSFLAKKYLDQGYQVSLMGQSMGASVSVAAAAQPELQDQIQAVLLWVPDAKSEVEVDPDQIYEEAGQQYYGRFWQEAKEADFFGCLDKFKGKIHLVYGEKDRYVTASMRQSVITAVKAKGGQVMILPGEDHSPWQWNHAQQVMKQELALLEEIR